MSKNFYPEWEHGHIYDGLPARVICVNAKGDYPIVALVTTCDGITEFTRFFKLSGESQTSSVMRIYNAPAPKRKFVRWVNMYEGTDNFKTRENADDDAQSFGDKRIACVRVEFEEGDGL
jgi:hypothetical protein